MVKDVKIYKGNIYRIFIEDVKLDKGNVVPTVSRELVEEDAEFYTFLKTYVKLSSNSVYIDEAEANDYVYFYFERYKDKVMDYLNNPKINSHDRKEFLDYLKAVTGCQYIFPSRMKLDHTISRQEFKELKKRYKEEMKKKN